MKLVAAYCLHDISFHTIARHLQTFQVRKMLWIDTAIMDDVSTADSWASTPRRPHIKKNIQVAIQLTYKHRLHTIGNTTHSQAQAAYKRQYNSLTSTGCIQVAIQLTHKHRLHTSGNTTHLQAQAAYKWQYNSLTSTGCIQVAIQLTSTGCVQVVIRLIYKYRPCTGANTAHKHRLFTGGNTAQLQTQAAYRWQYSSLTSTGCVQVVLWFTYKHRQHSQHN